MWLPTILHHVHRPAVMCCPLAVLLFLGADSSIESHALLLVLKMVDLGAWRRWKLAEALERDFCGVFFRAVDELAVVPVSSADVGACYDDRAAPRGAAAYTLLASDFCVWR